MPRSARIDMPNLLQHVIVRGIERRNIFTDDEDRFRFVARFSDLLVSTGTDCLAWALLDNHFHLLIRPKQITLARFMRRLLTSYAVTFNLRHSRSGHLFQNRYKSLVCEEEEYLLELVRYIHLNPFRAGIVGTLEELDRYAWSGHAVLLGKRKLSGQIVDEVLSRFGKSSVSRWNYRSFIQDGIPLGRRNDLMGFGRSRKLASDPIEERQMRDTRILGGGDFVGQILQRTEFEPDAAKLSLEEIVERVRVKFGLTLQELTSRTRAKRIANARSIVCYVAFNCGHRGVDIARHLGLTGPGVSVASNRGKKAISEHLDLLTMLNWQVSK
jgi:REP element-mobilizing transposase RayT